jgi:hypothetical protein
VRSLALVLLDGLPGHGLDIAAVDADIGKLAVAQPGQFVQITIIPLPLMNEADDGGKHCRPLSVGIGIGPMNRVTGKIVISGRFKRNFAALQLGEKRIA